MTVTIKATELNPGDALSVQLATIAEPTTLIVENVSGTVIAATEKALRVEFDSDKGRPRRLWLPRRALVKLERDGRDVSARLANWFKPNDAQARAFGVYRLTATLQA